jgi:hypothetical protein
MDQEFRAGVGVLALEVCRVGFFPGAARCNNGSPGVGCDAGNKESPHDYR